MIEKNDLVTISLVMQLKVWEDLEVLVVEDSERGLQAAVAAGIRCVVIPRGLTRSSDFSKAHVVLNEIGEFRVLALSMV